MTLLQVGDITVQRIVEHEVPVYLPTDLFDEATPAAMAPHRPWLEPHAMCPRTGRLVMPVQSYLVRTSHHCILIDSCCGRDKTYAEPPEWHQQSNDRWLANLRAGGVQPEDIDYVFCTHLHSDHCGWNTRRVDGYWVPTFPNAKYVFARVECEAMKAEGSDIFKDNVLPILEAGQAVLVDMDYALDDEVWLEPTVGHSVGHVAVNLASGGNRGVMCGDLIHSPVQLIETAWSLNSDHDPAAATTTRQSFLAEHCDTGNLVLTAHFPSPSMGHIISRGQAYGFKYV